MKKIVLFFLLLLPALGVAQRLPGTVMPQHYTLTIAPNFNDDSFTGEETIKVRLEQPATSVTLHALELDFLETSISSGGKSQKATVKLEPDNEMAVLTVPERLPAGPAEINVRYAGKLNKQLRGLYLSQANNRKYAVTQMEATDARRAFPSFDEPAFKATFDIALVVDKGDIAISNSKIVSDTPGPGEDKHTIKFATTPKMSTYLVALLVGDFKCLSGSADGVPIRVCATPDKVEMGRFALKAAEQQLAWFNRYFEIPYPFGKLDLIALPDFEAGAMENIGAITYRETALLIDDKTASVEAHRDVAKVTAHEIAHQWFGDLVTMMWWDNIWLNEGFASWMEYKPVKAWEPEWNLGTDEVIDTAVALNADSLFSTRTIRAKAETAAQINEMFDRIAYEKSAAVLRMLENYVGEEPFRKGVVAYLRKHSWGNATAEDLWSAIAKASGKPVDRIMPTYVTQPGVPLVRVQAACKGNSTVVKLSQQRYFYGRERFNAGSPEVWQIPVCMKAANGKSVCKLLTKKTDEATLPGCSDWVYANSKGQGYYRVEYEPAMLRSLAGKAVSALTGEERVALLTDEWAAARVGLHQISDYMLLAESLKQDRNRAVLEMLTERLHYIDENLLADTDRPQFQSWVRELLRPAMQDVGWNSQPGEGDDRKLFRAILFLTLGETGGDPDVQARARELVERYLRGSDAVEPSLIGAAFKVAAINGDAQFQQRLISQLRSAKTPEDTVRYRSALVRFRDPELLRRVLELAMSPEVRSQDTPRYFTGVMENPDGRQVAWEYMKANLPAIEEKLGYAVTRVAAGMATFCNAGLRNDVTQFFERQKLPAAERRLKQSLEQANYCIDLKAQQQPRLTAWLKEHSAVGGE
ncbi:MAG: ERAP1-like C-terminal domain-containing protein [Acidobacteriales bacterium]|nr:ERAP1-like C-terminal domain-containing protein [Terriglobales bacterium]